MRIAICDDEKSMGQILEEKVKKLLPDAVVEKYLSGDDLISSGFKPDILFMDIQMPGKDGMETARIVRRNNKDMILIFVTAVEEYVFQADCFSKISLLKSPFFIPCNNLCIHSVFTAFSPKNICFYCTTFSLVIQEFFNPLCDCLCHFLLILLGN